VFALLTQHRGSSVCLTIAIKPQTLTRGDVDRERSIVAGNGCPYDRTSTFLPFCRNCDNLLENFLKYSVLFHIAMSNRDRSKESFKTSLIPFLETVTFSTKPPIIRPFGDNRSAIVAVMSGPQQRTVLRIILKPRKKMSLPLSPASQMNKHILECNKCDSIIQRTLEGVRTVHSIQTNPTITIGETIAVKECGWDRFGLKLL
jgi:hypothetical protein